MGPLAGVKILELEGSAEPVCRDAAVRHGRGRTASGSRSRSRDRQNGASDPTLRGRQTLVVDSRATRAVGGSEAGRNADALIEGFRPGVMERLGLGPDELLRANPKLIYGRVTGYGSPAVGQAAGHDINYIALSGVLGRPARW